MSGYCASESLEFEFTTDYSFGAEDDNPERFTVTFPCAEIKSASFFDFDAWREQFGSENESQRPPAPRTAGL